MSTTAHRVGRWLVILAVPLVLLATPAQAATVMTPSSAPSSPSRPFGSTLPAEDDSAAAVDAYLRSEIEELRLPGAALAIIRNGSIEHLAAFGEADDSGRSMTPQTPVLLASVSKQFTATAIMQLVEAGTVELSAPVQRYLPWFRVADPVLSARITVEQLLHHTSGLPDTADNVVSDVLGDDQDPASLEAGVRALAAVELRHPPGAAFEYANTGYNTLGMIVEEVSGQRFADYVDEHIFVPLTMTHSHGTVSQSLADGGAQGYYSWFGAVYVPETIATPVGFAPSAMLFSSAEDLAHVIQMNLQKGQYDGATVLSPDSVVTMRSSGVEMGLPGVTYGMGWVNRPQRELSADPGDPVADAATARVIEHNGSWTNTHTYISYVPASGTGIVLLVNGNDTGAESRLAAVDRNLWRVLLDQPTRFAEDDADFLVRYGAWVGLVLVAMQLALMWWSIWLLRRRSRTGIRVPARRRRAALLVPLAFDVAIVTFVVWYLPAYFESSLQGVIRYGPDSGLLIVIALTLAIGWGTVRTILLLRRPCTPVADQLEQRAAAIIGTG